MALEKNHNNIELKRIKEELVVSEMIGLYCQKHGHVGNNEVMCDKCQQLCDYAKARIRLCPFMEKKSFCATCKVHCYKPEMREQIRRIMRYSGPRMIFYHPVMVIRHMITSMLDKYK